MVRDSKVVPKKTEVKFVLEKECTCDGCGKIIYRKKIVPCYNASIVTKNPLDVTFFKLTSSDSIFSTEEYCKDCYKDAVEEKLAAYDELTIVKECASCYYTECKEVKDDKKG